MVDMLIIDGFIVTVDGRRRTFRKGAIAIEGNRILDVGYSKDIKKRYTADKVVNAKNKAVLPGLINTHCHFHEIIVRSLGEDLKLLPWCKAIAEMSVDLTKEDFYYSALTGCIEQIKTGVTCTLDTAWTIPYSRPKLMDACLRSFFDVGIRGIEAEGLADIDAFQLFPSELIGEKKSIINDNVRLINEWHGKANGRISVWFGPIDFWLCTEELLKETYELSKKYDVGWTTHSNESQDEIKGCLELYGKRPIEYLNDLGTLGPNALLAHCVWVNNREIQLLKETDTKVAHNPLSNMILASGIAPISRMLKEGITIGLGLDGGCCNNNQDMFETIKIATLLQKVGTIDPEAITAERVLEMATIDGARALGLEKEVGSIEIGKKADITIVDLKQPNLIPVNRICSQLVYCGKGRNVDTVIVDGKVILEDRKIKTVNETEVLEKTQEASDALIERGRMQHLRERAWTSKP